MSSAKNRPFERFFAIFNGTAEILIPKSIFCFRYYIFMPALPTHLILEQIRLLFDG